MIMKRILKCIVLGCGLLFVSMRGADQVQVPAQTHEQTPVLGAPSESLRSLVGRDPQFEEVPSLHHVSSGELVLCWGLMAVQVMGLMMVVYHGAHA